MCGLTGPIGSLRRISIRASAALALRGASNAAALVASMLLTKVRRPILFMVFSDHPVNPVNPVKMDLCVEAWRDKNHDNPDNHVNHGKLTNRHRAFYRIYKIRHDLQDSALMCTVFDPRVGCVAVRRMTPADSFVFIQTAPAPPKSENGFSPMISPGPVMLSAIAALASGRTAPYSSVTRKTTRVASIPSPINSRSSGSTSSCRSAPL